MSGVVVSEAAKAKAVELANAADCTCQWTYADLSSSPALSTLARFIQEVSDAAKEAVMMIRNGYGDVVAEDLDCLEPFILPEPVDPLLIEAREIVSSNLRESGLDKHPIRSRTLNGERDGSGDIRLALAALKRGLELAGGAS